MQIRMKDQLSADEALMLLEVANAEVATIRQQLTEQEEIIEILEDANAALRDENAQQKLELEAIGAGGVSGKRITDDGTLDALRDCEQTYHAMMLSGTPENCQAHDKARARFWRVFGGAA